jgi:ribosomal protein S8
LQQHGFPSDAVDFAEEQIMMSYDDLVNDGWAARAVRFVLKVRKDIRNRQANALTTVFGEDSGARQFAEVPEGYDPKKDRDLEEDEDFEGEENAAQRKENHDFANRVKYEFLATLTDAQRALYDETSYLKEGAIWKGRNDAQVSQHKFEYATLQAFAGPAKRRSANYIEREGVTLNVMGLEVTKQPITFAKPEYADPDGLDDEGVVTQANRASRRLWLGLKYHDSMPVLSKLKLISKPTKRIWLSHSDLSRVIRGQEAGEVKGLRQIGEIMVVSTDRGIMEARDCVERRIGGQPLMRVW